MIEYAQDIEVEYRPVPRYGTLQLAPGERADGYGSKISTDYVVRFANAERKRGSRKDHEYRVYMMRWNKMPIYYVIRYGKKLVVKPEDLRVSAKLDEGG